jgi:alkylation response protein AidB-like acyl-CoA dehydrogenase
MNEEEHKLGIRASSTRQVFFNETKVPAENMLSDRGNGFKIAMNALNVGSSLLLLVLTRNVELLLMRYMQTKEYNLTRQ